MVCLWVVELEWVCVVTVQLKVMSPLPWSCSVPFLDAKRAEIEEEKEEEEEEELYNQSTGLSKY